MPRSRTRLARLVLHLTATNLVIAVLGVVTGPLLARSLGAGGRGVLAAIVVPLGLAPALLGLGLPSYATRSIARGASPGHSSYQWLV